jgi:hypothetical protein
MMEWIYKQPKLARMVGQALFSVFGFLIVCGMIGRVAMTAINSTREIGKLPPLNGLREAYPMYSLSWVLGALPWVRLLCRGCWSRHLHRVHSEDHFERHAQKTISLSGESGTHSRR